MQYSRLKSNILKRITPTESELLEIKEIIDVFVNALKKRAEKLRIDHVFIEAQGSTGKKQTQLIGASDIDIFMGLPPEKYSQILNLENIREKKEKLKRIFLKIIDELFIPVAKENKCENIGIFYAEHPYLNLKKGKYDVDMVICFALTEQEILETGPITAVDRTPIHSNLIYNAMNDEQRDDVRLLKAFIQACHAYGDKSAVGQFGFTGYSTEVLILHFKSLEDTFRNFQLIEKEPIDFFGRKPKELLNNPRFKNDSFIIIDPTDKNRNVGSSISKRAYDYVKFRISKFLESPSEDFFELQPIGKLSDNESSKIQSNTWVLEFKSDGKVHYTELRDKLFKLGEQLKFELEKENTGEVRFGKCVYTIYYEDLIYGIAFHCSQNNISKIYTRKGPPLNLKDHVNKFKEKNPDFFTKDGHVHAKVERIYTRLSDLISDFMKNYKIKGLEFQAQSSVGINDVGKKALFILYKIILPLKG